jgi:hypothetical protein
MNSWYHARSAVKKWGGSPDDYIAIEELIDSSKQFIGDIRHRALFHHTYGVWVCQRIFGRIIKVEKQQGALCEVPVRLIAEQHILEDLGWLPSPADYISGMPIKPWMSGAKMRDEELSVLGLTDPRPMAHTDLSDRSELIKHLHSGAHGGYPAGHDFVLVSTANIIQQHVRKHEV